VIVIEGALWAASSERKCVNVQVYFSHEDKHNKNLRRPKVEEGQRPYPDQFPVAPRKMAGTQGFFAAGLGPDAPRAPDAPRRTILSWASGLQIGQHPMIDVSWAWLSWRASFVLVTMR
jgi:hypothetical protein